MWWRTSNCNSLLIYRPREDERLSWFGWLTLADGLPTIKWLQVECRTAKERWRETDILPLSHADQAQASAIYIIILRLLSQYLFQFRREGWVKKVTWWLTACTLGSAPGPALGSKYGGTSPLIFCILVTNDDDGHGHTNTYVHNVPLRLVELHFAILSRAQVPML